MATEDTDWRIKVETTLARHDECLTAAKEAVGSAFRAKEEDDKHRNAVLETLRSVITDCITEAEYTRRHEALDMRITLVERNMWKAIGGLAVLGILLKYFIK